MTVAISATGLWTPADSVTNAELVASFNAYVERYNAEHAAEIAEGARQALQPSSVEFIEKASGIKHRFVLDKQGSLDVSRMVPRIPERPNDQISLMAEVSVKAATQALERAGRDPRDVDAVICSCSSLQRPYPALAIEVRIERFASREDPPVPPPGVPGSAAPGLPLTAAEARQVDFSFQSCGDVVAGAATTSE